MRKVIQRNLAPAPISVSSTNVYTSLWQPMDSFQSYMIQVVWSGTPSATLAVLVSSDPIPQLETFEPLSSAAPHNYDVSSGSTANAAGRNIVTYDCIQTAANWVAVQWTNVSGTGTITSINFVAKGSQI